MSGKKPMCRPLSLWNATDIWKYIKRFKIPYSKIYDIGFERSGCVACMFGMSLEKMYSDRNPNYLNRFELLEKHNKKIFDIFVINEKYGLWKPLIDMGIILKTKNKTYLKLSNERKEKLKKWNENFEKNFEKVLDEILHRNPEAFNLKEKRQLIKKYSINRKEI